MTDLGRKKTILSKSPHHLPPAGGFLYISTLRLQGTAVFERNPNRTGRLEVVRTSHHVLFTENISDDCTIDRLCFSLIEVSALHTLAILFKISWIFPLSPKFTTLPLSCSKIWIISPAKESFKVFIKIEHYPGYIPLSKRLFLPRCLEGMSW